MMAPMPSSLRLAPALFALALASSGPGAVAPAAAPREAVTAAAAPAEGFTALEPGLDLGVFAGPSPTRGDGKIWVARVDPARFELKVVNASAGDGRPRTVRAWAVGAGAAAAINASMFQTDGLTSVGLMRTRLHENNPRRSARYKALLALDPLDPSLPALRIVDAGCGEADGLAPRYGTLVQSIRMVSCERKNVWAPDARRWSTAALGVDGAGRALFVHARSPWPVHDLADALLALPLDLRRAMYLEGGPEAQLYVRGGGREVERVGAFEGNARDDASAFAWEIPNAIVAVRRAR
jgi:Phosphodiester glycosidase